MAEQTIRFDDGAGYERYMGMWSRSVGRSFLDWLAPLPGWSWLDVGCGSGAFTQLVADSCRPSALAGIDPAGSQLAHAGTRPGLERADFRLGHAMELPFPAGSFDAAVMPLVIYFVPDPAVGVSEMARVVGSGGVVAAYAWDMDGGGPYRSLHDAFGEMGMSVPRPPSPEASRMEVLRALWGGAGLGSIDSRTIVVERAFESFEDYWETIQGGPNAKVVLESMSAQERSALRERMQDTLETDSAGRITYAARANAIRGIAP